MFDSLVALQQVLYLHCIKVGLKKSRWLRSLRFLAFTSRNSTAFTNLGLKPSHQDVSIMGNSGTCLTDYLSVCAPEKVLLVISFCTVLLGFVLIVLGVCITQLSDGPYAHLSISYSAVPIVFAGCVTLLIAIVRIVSTSKSLREMNLTPFSSLFLLSCSVLELYLVVPRHYCACTVSNFQICVIINPIVITWLNKFTLFYLGRFNGKGLHEFPLPSHLRTKI
ncbi:unnamed protein product [Schistosoma guineensis]|nr:unnamed protein product [Schistosoma guineensis]